MQNPNVNLWKLTRQEDYAVLIWLFVKTNSTILHLVLSFMLNCLFFMIVCFFDNQTKNHTIHIIFLCLLLTVCAVTEQLPNNKFDEECHTKLFLSRNTSLICLLWHLPLTKQMTHHSPSSFPNLTIIFIFTLNILGVDLLIHLTDHISHCSPFISAYWWYNG